MEERVHYTSFHVTEAKRQSQSHRSLKRREFMQQHLNNNSDGNTRKPLTLKQAQEWFQDMVNKRSSKFGVRKLGLVNIDTRFDYKSIGFQDMDLRWEQVTLLECALILDRDNVVYQLLKAKAEFMDVLGEEASFVTTRFHELPFVTQIWVMKHLVKMGLAPVDGPCCVELSSVVDCGKCERPVSCASTKTRSLENLCVWPTCGHMFCLKCAWSTTFDMCDKSQEGFFACPSCGLVQEEDRPTLVGPDISKAESLSRFLTLPTVDDHNPERKQPKIRSMTLGQAKRFRPGTSQGFRLNKMFHAALNNDILRFRILFNEGLDIDVKNEYGHTALMICCLYKYETLAKELLLLGANPSIYCNIGVSIDAETLSMAAQQSDQLRKLELEEQQIVDGLPPATDLVRLINFDSKHPGRGACILDGFFSCDWMDFLEEVVDRAPVAEPTKLACSERSYVFDAANLFTDKLNAALNFALNQENCQVFQTFRVLIYREDGAYLPAHTDLPHHDVARHLETTHTVLLYLTDTPVEDKHPTGFNGETALLTEIPKTATPQPSEREFILHCVEPKRGRLLIYPHQTPHEGRVKLGNSIKKLLRGEAYIPNFN